MPQPKILSSHSIATSIILLFLFIFLTSTPASAQTLIDGGRLWTAITEKAFCPQDANRIAWANVTDASTGTRISRRSFSDIPGNIIRVLGGLAFDNTRRVVWYSNLLRSCDGSVLAPSRGDGFIYKTTARFGGSVSAIPDPNGPGGPGIGALDYDAEEDVLWAAVYRPVNGLSVFYKLNPNTGEVLKTITIPASLSTGSFPAPQINDTLAIARPGDLGGVKVLLTDAGAQDTSTLYAIDVNTGAILKTYPISGFAGIDIDEETGHLLAVRNGNTIFIKIMVLRRTQVT